MLYQSDVNSTYALSENKQLKEEIKALRLKLREVDGTKEINALRKKLREADATNDKILKRVDALNIMNPGQGDANEDKITQKKRLNIQRQMAYYRQMDSKDSDLSMKNPEEDRITRKKRLNIQRQMVYFGF